MYIEFILLFIQTLDYISQHYYMHHFVMTHAYTTLILGITIN